VVIVGSLSARVGCLVGCVLFVSALACVVADRSVASCPNEADVNFERFLAGCGAYERVSPPFKAGSQLSIGSAGGIAGDGSRILGVSIGVFGGDEGDGLNGASVFYQSVRSQSGWVTSAINPPSWLVPTQEFFDGSGDLTKSLWAVRRASEAVGAEEMVVREANGVFAEVGSLVPPTAAAEGSRAGEYQPFIYPGALSYRGASSDLSHVLFSIKGNGPMWPGDTTTNSNQGSQSLYEFVGTDNAQPELVGVNGEGRLISDCSTVLGSIGPSGEYAADTYNSISRDGETVFFTALGHQSGACGGELHAPEATAVYARVGQGPGARTVAISEPSSGDCETCQTGAPAAAEFQGASQDGSKVFFLSEQEVFKEHTTKDLYEYDFHNRPGHKLLRVSTGSKTPEVQGVARVSEDGSHVYFVARGVLTEGPNAEGGEPVAGGENLYVFERDASYPSGHVAFIATLSEADGGDWAASDEERPVQATPDGRYLVFQSVADLTNGDSSNVEQVFEYDAAREALVRVSVGEMGYAAGMESAEANASGITRQKYSGRLHPDTAGANLAVSDDGSVVVFESGGGLTRQASAAGEAGKVSVYEYRSAGTLSNGNVFSVSDGSSLFNAESAGVDASGGDVFFETASPVLESDGDSQSDLYDARSGGGFPAPAVVTDCEGVLSCHGGLAGVPVFGGVGSVSAVGGGNAPVGSAGAPSSRPSGSSRPPGLSVAQKLARALRVCRRERGHRRRVCEVRAHRRYRVSAVKGKVGG
jgi:hypothetical protein